MINQCLGNNKSEQYPIDFRHNSSEISNDDEISNIFLKHFFPQDENNVGINTRSSCTHNLPILERSAYIQPFTTAEIIIAISELKKNSFHTSDIPVELVQLVAPQVALYLSRVFNTCLSLGVFPQCLKTATIIPRFKKGHKFLINNYRPISNLNTFSKIFEKLIFKRLIDYCENKNILTPLQFGYLKGKGIEKAALTFLHDVYQAKLEGMNSAAVFIDFSKAFDTIDHDILIQRLHCYGVRGHFLDLIHSYLSNRLYRVRFRSAFSDPSFCNVGTPQGSSLSALLFIIYINDVVSYVNNSKILLYADDIVLYHSNSNVDALNTEIQADIDSISSYSTENKLNINIAKTKVLSFKLKSESDDPELKLYNQTIDKVNDFKYLGLVIDNKLSFKQHITDVTKKMNSINRTLFCLSHKLPYYMLIKLFYSIGFPHMNLHIIAWGGAQPTALQPLKIAANKIIRNIRRVSPFFDVNTENAYNCLNILSIPKLYELRLSEFMYSSIQGKPLIPHNFLSKYKFEHSYSTRRPSNFRLPLCRTRNEGNSFIFRGIKQWETLPKELKELPNIYTFHREAKKHLLKNTSLSNFIPNRPLLPR